MCATRPGRGARRGSVPLTGSLLVGRSSLLLSWQGWGEKVGEQSCDALIRVVMDPVRGARYALDAVEVGYVVVIGLGQFGAEVPIVLTPDDQGRRGDRAQRRFGALRGLPHRGPVVVDHSRCGSRL